jgi:predicted metal-binding membrane protein
MSSERTHTSRGARSMLGARSMIGGMRPSSSATGTSLVTAALLASALAWLGLLLAAEGGTGAGLYGSSMIVGATPGTMLMFLAAWETMVIAMMLPTSLRFLALFGVLTSTGPNRLARRTAVCVGYGLVWAGVGCIMIVISDTLYHSATVGIWLANHANLLAGGVLTLAGGFQLTALKRRCLSVCSHPEGLLMRHYGRGGGRAFALGLRYGLFCLGCCWALMLVMVILGGDGLYLLMLLTAIMFVERVVGWERRFVKTVGLTCVLLGALIVASPTAIPALAQGARAWAGMQAMQLPHPAGLVWCHA